MLPGCVAQRRSHRRRAGCESRCSLRLRPQFRRIEGIGHWDRTYGGPAASDGSTARSGKAGSPGGSALDWFDVNQTLSSLATVMQRASNGAVSDTSGAFVVDFLKLAAGDAMELLSVSAAGWGGGGIVL